MCVIGIPPVVGAIDSMHILCISIQTAMCAVNWVTKALCQFQNRFIKSNDTKKDPEKTNKSSWMQVRGFPQGGWCNQHEHTFMALYPINWHQFTKTLCLFQFMKFNNTGRDPEKPTSLHAGQRIPTGG